MNHMNPTRTNHDPATKVGRDWGPVTQTRNIVSLIFLLIGIATSSQSSSAQPSSDLQTYFQQSVGLSSDQIASIQSGKPVTKALPSRTPAEVFLFGAVYIHAAPESYVKFAQDYNRLRKVPSNLALGVISSPPQLSDFKGFTFDADDIKELKNCKPGNCLIQIPEGSIEELQKTVNWSAADLNDQLNQQLQKAALQRLLAYQRNGNQALGVYVDKPSPTDVSKQFTYMLSYDKALPAHLPDFYHYLLFYPNGKPANVDNSFYWARVKFGLKPSACRPGDNHARQRCRSNSLRYRRKAALLEPLL